MRKLCVILLFTTALCQAQEDIDKSLKMDFKLPVPVSNESFTRLVNGISDISLSLQFPIAGNVCLGFGAKHNLYQINEFNLPEHPRGDVQFWAGYLKLAYEQFVRPRVYYELSMKGGYTLQYFKSNICAINNENSVYTDGGVLIEPQAAVYMISKDNLSFGLIASFPIILNDFEPRHFCLDNFSGFAEDFSKGPYGSFVIGFGFSLYLNKDTSFKN